MSHISSQRQERDLAQISRSLSQVVKVLEAMNENMGSVGRIFKAWLDAVDEEPTMSEVHQDVKNVLVLVANMSEQSRTAGLYDQIELEMDI